MKRLILKHGEEARILAGHPWVYASEVACVLAAPGSNEKAELSAGECADVESAPFKSRQHGEYLGRAIVNPSSQIIARIYSRSKEGLDKGFFKRRIREAAERRTFAGYDLSRDSCRIVFSEADFLPGLIVDRFVSAESGESFLAVQFLACGMDSRREMILDALEELFAPTGIFEKSAAARELEGLPLREGLARGASPAGGRAVICEGGVKFKIDFSGGQKTGFYLDQSANHKYAARISHGEHGGTEDTEKIRVLDCFSYTGGFTLHIAKALQERGCACEVTAVDSSSAALSLLRENAALNGVADAVRTVESDVFAFLRRAEERREQFGFIVLDPPPFAKNRAALEGALRGYREINSRALRLFPKAGGVFVACSCSFAVGEERFKRMLADAARDAGRRLHQLEFRSQAACHPILVGFDESYYLKCGFFRVLTS